ncbi:hypothetical protein AcW1_005510 [Taiwanofungus camphoratus]|nr:hypothetical protein AcW2_004278 [Antrodia cinnamomea]KAI0933771.1 hypothetical protein AcV5_005832 [Antrodia cinnamomea]KAI0948431.1 hypothetical protein AcV7_009178 [Antrodia cinnamomea]KAI0956960.1 hypothetical protein AcW1_005510 [Antrodia cinnamomea]
MMNKMLGVALGAAGTAGNLSGLPYLATTVSIVQGIQTACGQVVLHKKHCAMIADRTVQLMVNLGERAPRLEGSELQTILDEVNEVLQSIHSRVTKWSRYSRLQAFWKDGKIEDGLLQCESDMQSVMQKFSLDSAVVIHRGQLEIKGMLERNHDELKDLLLQILRSPQDLLRAAEMERAGKHVAERIMEEGQNQLRVMREQQTGVVSQTGNDNACKETYEQCQQGLVELHRLTGIPPSIKRLDGEVVRYGEYPVEKGPRSQVWIGYWLGNTKVALKALQGFAVSDRARSRFAREVKIWAKLNHPHVLQFYGIVTNLGPQLHTVSPWQENGNILEYVQRYPRADRMDLLLGAAKGLEYLHQQEVIHGTVRCANILVTAEGKACICDFGMSQVIEDITDIPASATLTKAGSARWLSPELIENTVSLSTRATDVYSFAMAMLECFTLKPPFADLKRDAHVIAAILIQNRNPHRPNTPLPTDDIWELMLQCWSLTPEERPSMAVVVVRLRDSMSNSNMLL